MAKFKVGDLIEHTVETYISYKVTEVFTDHYSLLHKNSGYEFKNVDCRKVDIEYQLIQTTAQSISEQLKRNIPEPCMHTEKFEYTGLLGLKVEILCKKCGESCQQF